MMKRFAVLILLIPAGMLAAQDQALSAGLKDALKVSLKNAVTQVAAENGYYGNELIKILLPEKLDKASKFLNKIGAEQLTETLIERMNRGAEAAAPKAMDIFLQTIKDIQFQDAAKILSGEQHALTNYLKDTTRESLHTSFYPVVKQTLEEMAVLRLFNEYTDKYSKNPLLQKVDLDLSEYVTSKALDGLFVVVAGEEEKIRTDPKARVTDLIKDVFGKLGN